MAMDVREKLIELLDRFVYDEWYGNDYIADKLIPNGVTVQECKPEDKKTNADCIRAMSDEKLHELLNEIYNAGVEDSVSYAWGDRKDSFEWTMDWLQHPAEDGE